MENVEVTPSRTLTMFGNACQGARVLVDRGHPHGALGDQTPFELTRPTAGHAQLSALHG